VRSFCAGAACLALAAPLHADEIAPGWTVRALPPPVLERPVGPNVFGTVALSVRPKPTSTRWSKLMRASLDQSRLQQIAADAQTMSTEQGIAYVQAAVSHSIRTGGASTNCSDDGYWAPAQETLARGLGDCFDVAIAKMEALRRLGVPDHDLYLTTGWFRTAYDPGKGRESVALLVRVGERFWLMPEGASEVVASNADNAGSTEFTPVVTYGVGMTWVHGKVVRVAALSAAPGASASVGSTSSPAR
jgi:hypothetical protein